MGKTKKNYCCNCKTPLEDGETICSVCGYDNTLYQNPKSSLPEKMIPTGKEEVISDRASLLGKSDLKPQEEEKKEEPRKPAAENRPKKNPNRLLPVLLAVLLAAGIFLYNGIHQNQLNTRGTQTAEAGTSTQSALELAAQQTADEQTLLTAQAGMTEQAAAAGTQTARETQEALSLQQTGTAWNLTATAEYQQTQTRSAIEASATQAEWESRMEQTSQAETQQVLNTAAAIQSEQTAEAWSATQEAMQIRSTAVAQTREAMDMRLTQDFFARQTETQAAAEALEQTRVIEEQQTAAAWSGTQEVMQTETAAAEQTLAAQMTATRSAERTATEAALEETQYAFHVMETQASFAETRVAIDLRMTAAAATETKAAEPTATPMPTETATPTPVPTNTPIPTETPKPVVRVGDIITFGQYEQDGFLSNGPEAIEWQVLTVENDRALVISRYGLDVKPYNEVITDVTWETSTLRAWLNGEFYDSAFSSEEKGHILEVTLKNPYNAEFGTKGGKDTTDRIFLLSIDEVKQYFANDAAMKCRPTTYAKDMGAYESKDFAGATWWWLRSPGISPKSAAGVGVDGKFRNFGDGVEVKNLAVRPAFWLDL